MSAIAEPVIVSDDHLAKRNALVLALAQALAGGNSVVIVGTAGIVGGMLADRAFGTLPVGLISKKFGRLAAFELGALCGTIAGLLCCLAVLQSSFGLLCAGTLFGGFYAAVHQSYRFAAADTARDAFKAKAISWVMAGGMFSAFVGPQLVIVTKDLWPPHLFAASYLAQAPVAMLDCNHSVTDAALGLQWHVLAMFAPSLFTGTLITRFGTDRVAGCGLAIIAAGALLALTGITIWHFWAALVLLGIGWNFAFVGATALVTLCHRPNECNKVQAVNDFLVFGSMALGSFSSGALLARYGWNMVAEVVLPVVLVAGVLLVGANLMARPKPA